MSDILMPQPHLTHPETNASDCRIGYGQPRRFYNRTADNMTFDMFLAFVRESRDPWYSPHNSLARRYSAAHPYIVISICPIGALFALCFLYSMKSRVERTWIDLSLTFVAICDGLVLVSCSVYVLHFDSLEQDFCSKTKHSHAWASFGVTHVVMSVIMNSSSVYMTTFVGVKRALLLRESEMQNMPTKKHVGRAVLSIFGAVTITCIPLIISTGVVKMRPKVCNGVQLYFVGVSNLASKYPSCQVLAFWINGVCLKFLPTTLLSVSICSILWSIRRAARQRRVVNIVSRSHYFVSVSLILLMTSFVLTQIPQIAINLGVALMDAQHEPLLFRSLGELCDLLSIICLCVSLPLYCLGSRSYRASLCLSCGPRYFRRIAVVQRKISDHQSSQQAELQEMISQLTSTAV